MRRIPGADRAGRARRRGDREHAGARPRARLGRLRRSLREPDPRARPRRGGGRARDEAAVHTGAVRRAACRGARPARGIARRNAGRVLLAAQPAVPVCAALAGAPRRLRPARRRRAAGRPVRHGARAEGTRADRCRCHRRSVLRGRRRVRLDLVGAGVGEGVGSTTSPSARSVPASSARDPHSATGAWPPRLRRTPRSRWGAARSSPPACRKPIRGGAIRASRTTRGRCSTSAPAEWRSAKAALAGEEACDGLPLSHMGRGPDDDPIFFQPPMQRAGLPARS